MSERTWQLAMSGHGLEHVIAEACDDMARLLNLVPSISHLTVEVGNDRTHVARNWPSNRMDKEYPNGRRELVRFDNEGEHVVSPLPAIEPRI